MKKSSLDVPVTLNSREMTVAYESKPCGWTKLNCISQPSLSRMIASPLCIYELVCRVLKSFAESHTLVSRPSRAPSRKKVWYIAPNFLVVLSQHVWKKGNPIRLLGLCDIRLTVSLCGSMQRSRTKHMTIAPCYAILVHMLTQDNQEIRCCIPDRL